VGQVVSSRRPDFPVGQLVHGGFGWQDYALTDGRTEVMPVAPLPPGATPEQGASVFGLTGLTAYFGLKEIGRPRPGETVLVSAAAGATGSVAVQLAKAWGCRVIGIAGGPEKCAWVREEAGADDCIDYKAENVWEALGRLAPQGVDVVFENVGGPILEAAIVRLARGGRIVMCGAIAEYQTDPREQKGVRFVWHLSAKRGRMEGFIVLDYEARYPEAWTELSALVAAGKLSSTAETLASSSWKSPSRPCRFRLAPRRQARP
jgi:NADPH-dependent curcumin reductase